MTNVEIVRKIIAHEMKERKTIFKAPGDNLQLNELMKKAIAKRKIFKGSIAYASSVMTDIRFTTFA
jgi:hypothetical protein